MDIALCKIDTEKQIVQYSGAHRPLYMMHKGEIAEYEGDGRAIGGNPLREMMLARKLRKKQQKGEEAKPVDEKFTTHTIEYSKGDRLFMFSDGLPDQFKGEEPPKYSNARIRNLITSHANNPIHELHDAFYEDFNAWKEGGPQLDDVLLIGLQL
jgi:serine phosphatase RsbU (regulator of sigma subunit)